MQNFLQQEKVTEQYKSEHSQPAAENNVLFFRSLVSTATWV